MPRRIVIIATECKRCHKPITTLSRSLYGFDSLKAQYGEICGDCMTPEEQTQLQALMGGQLAEKYARS